MWFPGALLPQRSLNESKVAEYIAEHPTLGPWLDRVQAFDVFSSFWFTAIYVLLFVSLVGCLTPRLIEHFRSLRATIVAMVPLVITTIICKALMVWMGIGLKVATLPVIAVGVGVGVDYALYLLSVQIAMQRRGSTLAEAYRRSLDFTGRVVALVGLTMAAGVITWAFSPIKFQADMGILLTFMFLWNMVGALVLIPALSHFLLNPRQTKSALPADGALPL